VSTPPRWPSSAAWTRAARTSTSRTWRAAWSSSGTRSTSSPGATTGRSRPSWRSPRGCGSCTCRPAPRPSCPRNSCWPTCRSSRASARTGCARPRATTSCTRTSSCRASSACACRRPSTCRWSPPSMPWGWCAASTRAPPTRSRRRASASNACWPRTATGWSRNARRIARTCNGCTTPTRRASPWCPAASTPSSSPRGRAPRPAPRWAFPPTNSWCCNWAAWCRARAWRRWCARWPNRAARACACAWSAATARRPTRCARPRSAG